MASYVGKTPARQGIVADNTITSSQIVDNTISTSDILDSTITGSDLASNIVINTTGSITSGALTACGLSYPTTDGTSGQVIQTDGAGNLTFATASGGGGDVVDDTTPQLGGNLDLNSFDITGTNICINASGCLGIGNQAAPTSSYNIDIAASGTSGNIRLQRANVSSQYMLIGVSDGSKHQIQGYGDKDMYLCNRGANGSIYLATYAVNNMRMDRCGNVGFGKTSVCATQFMGSGTAYLHLEDPYIKGGNVIIGNGCFDSALYINAGTACCSIIFFDDGTTCATKVARINYDHSDDSMIFATNVATGQNTESMRIDSSGTLFVGVTSEPTSGDDGAQISNGSYHVFARNVDTPTVFRTFGSTGEFRTLGNGNAQNTNNSYGAISDRELKENEVEANSQWNDIKALQIKNYNLKSQPNQTHLGVIAQDLEASGMNGVVEQSEDEIYSENDVLPEGKNIGDVKEKGYKTVKYSILYMKAVKALQEAMERIETLEAKVTALENK